MVMRFQSPLVYINTIKLELSTAQTYEHTLNNVKSVVDRQRCPIAAKCFVCLLVRTIASFLLYKRLDNFRFIAIIVQYIVHTELSIFSTSCLTAISPCY